MEREWYPLHNSYQIHGIPEIENLSSRKPYREMTKKKGIRCQASLICQGRMQLSHSVCQHAMSALLLPVALLGFLIPLTPELGWVFIGVRSGL